MASGLKNLSGFKRGLKNGQKQFEDAALKRQKDIAKAIVIHLVNATPVDTRKAQSNWQTGIGSTPTSVIDPTSASETIARCFAVIDALQLGEVLYIVNNVDYLKWLIMGSSVQAPQDFVNKAVQRAVRESRT